MNYRYRLIERNCEVCGKPFTAKVKHGSALVCSPKCQRVKQLNNMWQEHTCQVCGKVFKSQNRVQPTCSRKCGMQEVYKRKKIARQRICVVCQKVFDPGKPSSPHQACSMKCSKVLLRQTNINETLALIENTINEPADEWLEREYQSRTMKDICHELKIGHTQRLARLMNYLGIKIRTKAEENELMWKQHPELLDFYRKHAAKVNRNMSLNSPTSIERIMANALDEAGIEYEAQGLIEKIYPCDFVLRNYWLIIECDGEYWHSKPEAIIKDARKDAYLQARGWTILRFSDKIINKDIHQCIRAIQSFIQN